MDELREVFVLQCDEGDLETQEKDHDIVSAFSLLMYHIKERQECIEHLKGNVSYQ